MKIECPNCKHSGEVPDSKIPEKAIEATCPKCKNKFSISRLNEKITDVENNFTWINEEARNKTVQRLEAKTINKLFNTKYSHDFSSKDVEFSSLLEPDERVIAYLEPIGEKIILTNFAFVHIKNKMLSTEYYKHPLDTITNIKCSGFMVLKLVISTGNSKLIIKFSKNNMSSDIIYNLLIPYILGFIRKTLPNELIEEFQNIKSKAKEITYYCEEIRFFAVSRG